MAFTFLALYQDQKVLHTTFSHSQAGDGKLLDSAAANLGQFDRGCMLTHLP